MDIKSNRFRKLSQISQKLAKSVDTLDVLDEVLAEVVEYSEMEAGWIFLYETDYEKVSQPDAHYLASQYNLPRELASGNINMWQGGCECLEKYESGTKVEDGELLACSRFDCDHSNRLDTCHHLSIPLLSANRSVGLLNVVPPDGEDPSPEAVEILNMIGAHLSTALDRQRVELLVKEKLIREQNAILELTRQLLSRTSLESVISYLVEEVVRLFRVDACALLLPDEQPGFLEFRASTGWHSDPVVEHRRVADSELSSSGKAMSSQQPIVIGSSLDREAIPDMTLAWLDSENFEGLAIIPLIVDGQSIGALDVAVRRPRDFTDDEIRFLQILANQAGIAIVKTGLQKEEIRLQRLEEELLVGRNIQRSLLPDSSPTVPGWQFCDIYKPARQIGGDLYDYFTLPFAGERLGIFIGDVADKGVPAALFMATSRTLIRSTALAGLTPSSALVEANKLILQDGSSELFLSAFYGILDTKSGSLIYANAGHNPPLLYKQSSGEFQELSAQGMVLCVLDDISLEEKIAEIARGDVLVLYTDGLTEAMDENSREFGIGRLQQVVADHAHKNADQILAAIIEAIESFVGNIVQTDDLTVVVTKRL